MSTIQTETLTEPEMMAYCFGFFDGEGCIQVVKARPKRSYTVCIRAFQKEIAPLLLLKSVFGGVIYTDKICGIKRIYRWEMRDRKGMHWFLKNGLRYLFCKKSEAQSALNLLNLTSARGREFGRWKSVTDLELSAQKVFYDQCRNAKRVKSFLLDDDGQSELRVSYKIDSPK